MIEGSLEVKLPTIWTDEKQSRAEAERRERSEERRSEKRKSQKKEDGDARKGRNVAIHCVFRMICGSGGSKVAGAEPAGQRRDEICTPLWRSTFPSQNVKSTRGADHFWHLRCRKSARHCGAKHMSKWKCTKHTSFGPLLEVAMSKKWTLLWREAHFQVKMWKNTSASDRFWKLRCRKSARPCGAKHISKSKCTKHFRFGPLLEVAMSKKCTPLWREAHVQVKMYKTPQRRTAFGSCDVEKVHAVVARSPFSSQNVQSKHLMYGLFLAVQMSFRVAGARDCGPCQKWAKREGFVAFSTTTTTTLHYTPIH